MSILAQPRAHMHMVLPEWHTNHSTQPVILLRVSLLNVFLLCLSLAHSTTISHGFS